MTKKELDQAVKKEILLNKLKKERFVDPAGKKFILSKDAILFNLSGNSSLLDSLNQAFEEEKKLRKEQRS